MRHPKRSITRTTRTRKPRHPGREPEELAATTWPESIRVEERMTRGAVTVRWDEPVREAWTRMKTGRLRHLPVLDEDGRLVGIVTDRDLRQVVLDPALHERLAAEIARTLDTAKVRDIMTWGVLTVRPGTPLRDAARLMHQHKIGALPVVERDRVVGMLTETDVVKAFAEVLDEAILSRRYRWAFSVP
jgi:acetoin utilization protein AcuB